MVMSGGDGTDSRLQRGIRLLGILLMLVGLCVLETRVVLSIQSTWYSRGSTSIFGFTVLFPDQIAAQNRLLGPYLVKFLSTLSGPTFEIAHHRALQALIWLATILCFMLVRRETGKNALGLIGAAVFAGSVIALQDQHFSVSDAIDLSTFLLFAYAVFYRRDHLPSLTALFVIQLLNSQTALFIALWVVISGFASIVDGLRTHTAIIRAIGRSAVGIALLAVSLFLALLAGHRLPLGEGFTLIKNLHSFERPTLLSFDTAIFICLLIGILVRRIGLSRKTRAYPVQLLLTIMAVSLWLFGNVTDVHEWLIFVPFLVLFGFTDRHWYKTESFRGYGF